MPLAELSHQRGREEELRRTLPDRGQAVLPSRPAAGSARHGPFHPPTHGHCAATQAHPTGRCGAAGSGVRLPAHCTMTLYVHRAKLSVTRRPGDDGGWLLEWQLILAITTVVHACSVAVGSASPFKSKRAPTQVAGQRCGTALRGACDHGVVTQHGVPRTRRAGDTGRASVLTWSEPLDLLCSPNNGPHCLGHSTVTLLARFLGLSTSVPRATAV